MGIHITYTLILFIQTHFYLYLNFMSLCLLNYIFIHNLAISRSRLVNTETIKNFKTNYIGKEETYVAI